jgi:putative addiction module component (TIGR02574 family)
MQTQLLQSVTALPLAERVELAEAIWESIAEDGYEPELSHEQRAELDRRIAAHEANPGDVVSWDEVKTDILKKLNRDT